MPDTQETYTYSNIQRKQKKSSHILCVYIKLIIDMTKKQAIQLFEERKVRTVWDDEQEKWYFSIVDIVAVLTDSADPKQYKKG